MIGGLGQQRYPFYDDRSRAAAAGGVLPTVTISSDESADELAQATGRIPGPQRPGRTGSHQFAVSHFDGLDRIGGGDRSPDVYSRPWRSNSLTPLATAPAPGGGASSDTTTDSRRSSYTQFGGIGPAMGGSFVFPPTKARSMSLTLAGAGKAEPAGTVGMGMGCPAAGGSRMNGDFRRAVSGACITSNAFSSCYCHPPTSTSSSSLQQQHTGMTHSYSASNFLSAEDEKIEELIRELPEGSGMKGEDNCHGST